MRVESWNPQRFDREFNDVSKARLMKAAKVVKAATRKRCPVGTISRPMYRSGPYKGAPWTARDAGSLRKSVRITEKRTKTGRVSKKMNVRVYVGNDMAYYANIVEFSRPFMQPAFVEALPMVETIIGAGKQIGSNNATDRM